jgi:soluble lytic murein transglycosylase-like protein
MQLSGRSVDLSTVYKASIRKDDEFLTYLLAVIYVESRFIPTAVSHRNAYGLMQITPPAISDASVHCRIPARVSNKFHIPTNVQYGSCYLDRLYGQTQNWTTALIIYNAGYRGLTLYNKAEPLPTETANYVLQVHRAVSLCN